MMLSYYRIISAILHTIVPIYSTGIKDIMINFDVTINPVNWTSETIEFILEKQNLVFKKSLLNLENRSIENETFSSSYSRDALICTDEHNHMFVRLPSRTPIYVPRVSKSILVPTSKNGSFWELEQRSNPSETLTISLLVLSDSGGIPLDKVSLKFSEKKLWELKKVFQTQTMTYILATFEDEPRKSLFLIRLSNKARKIVDSFRCLELDNENFNPDFSFLTIKNEAETFYAADKGGESFHYIDLKDLDTYMTKDYNDSGCRDFVQTLEGVSSSCNETSLLLFPSTSTLFKTEFQTFKVSEIILMIYIGDVIKQTFAVLASRSSKSITIKYCSVGEKNICSVKASFEQKNDLNVYTEKLAIDSRKGLLVMPVKNGSMNALPFTLPLIDCEELTTCDSCLIVGFYLNCSWIVSDAKCNQDSIAKRNPNVCFVITKALYKRRNKLYLLKIQTNYHMNGDYERAEVKLDGLSERFAAYSFNTSYSALVHRPAQKISLHIYRATGGSMMATYDFSDPIIKLPKFKVVVFSFSFLVICVFIIVFAYFIMMKPGQESMADPLHLSRSLLLNAGIAARYGLSVYDAPLISDRRRDISRFHGSSAPKKNKSIKKSKILAKTVPVKSSSASELSKDSEVSAISTSSKISSISKAKNLKSDDSLKAEQSEVIPADASIKILKSHISYVTVPASKTGVNKSHAKVVRPKSTIKEEVQKITRPRQRRDS